MSTGSSIKDCRRAPRTEWTALGFRERDGATSMVQPPPSPESSVDSHKAAPLEMTASTVSSTIPAAARAPRFSSLSSPLEAGGAAASLSVGDGGGHSWPLRVGGRRAADRLDMKWATGVAVLAAECCRMIRYQTREKPPSRKEGQRGCYLSPI